MRQIYMSVGVFSLYYLLYVVVFAKYDFQKICAFVSFSLLLIYGFAHDHLN